MQLDRRKSQISKKGNKQAKESKEEGKVNSNYVT